MKPSIPISRNKGFTLIELLVASVISFTILGIVLSLINTQRRDFLTDQSRLNASQNLRTALELIGADIKITGQRVNQEKDLPIIQVFDGNGTDGDFDEHDRLVIQRRVIEQELSVCETVSGSKSTILVSTSSTTDIGCDYSDADDGNSATTPSAPDAIDDELNQFRNYRCRADTEDCDLDRTTLPTTAANCDDECVVALILDPTTGNNEFFFYTYEECIDANGIDNGSSGNDCTDKKNGENVDINNIIHTIPLENTRGTVPATSGWLNTYSPGSKIYILEEREYRLEKPEPEKAEYDGVLTLSVNRHDRWKDNSVAQNNGNPLKIVNQLAGFNLTIDITYDDDGDGGEITPPVVENDRISLNNSLSKPSGGWNYEWPKVDALRIDVELEASNPSASDLIRFPQGNGGCRTNSSTSERRLCLSSKFFPRNINSK